MSTMTHNQQNSKGYLVNARRLVAVRKLLIDPSSYHRETNFITKANDDEITGFAHLHAARGAFEVLADLNSFTYQYRNELHHVQTEANLVCDG